MSFPPRDAFKIKSWDFLNYFLSGRIVGKGQSQNWLFHFLKLLDQLFIFAFYFILRVSPKSQPQSMHSESFGQNCSESLFLYGEDVARESYSVWKVVKISIDIALRYFRWNIYLTPSNQLTNEICMEVQIHSRYEMTREF